MEEKRELLPKLELNVHRHQETATATVISSKENSWRRLPWKWFRRRAREKFVRRVTMSASTETSPTSPIKRIKSIPSRSIKRQEAEQNVTKAADKLADVISGNVSTEHKSNVPHQFSRPQYDSRDIDVMVKIIGSTIDTWKDRALESKKTRSRVRNLAEKWFKASCSFAIEGLDFTQVINPFPDF
jgi:hypothetical protein